MTFDVLERHVHTVAMPVDAGLARLLREGAGGAASPAGRKVLLELACAAERRPEAGARSVQVGAGRAQIAADELAALLARARGDGDPAADSLAAFLAGQFGVTETTEVSGG